MSKRFIDTGIFDDDWYMDLSKDAKILWLYFITKCDHAGVLKLNEKLCKVQTDIKDLPKVIKELGNRLVTVSEHLYFIPKFIEFQYPGFPNSKVRQQQSALDILTKLNLISEGKLTVTKLLVDSYDNEHDIDNGTEEKREVKKLTPEEIGFNFYVEQGRKAKEYTDQMSTDYVKLCYHLIEKNKDGSYKLPYVLKIKTQITLDDFSKLYKKSGNSLEKISTKIDTIQSTIEYHNKYDNLYLTINNWFNRDNK